MAISTSYAYSTSIYTNVASTGTGPAGSQGKPPAVATTLRNQTGVQVTLSPAALEALAQQAAETTPDQEKAITDKLQQVLKAVMLTSGDQARRADAEPLPPDAAHRARAAQAARFLDGAAANPFRGKSLDDLAAVILNADGTATLNERRAALSELARQDHARMMDEVTPQTEFDRRIADAEKPKSGTAARLASAEKATAFLKGKGSNPFEGQNRQALTAIIDNDGGDYTINERRAALAERTAQEQTIMTQLGRTMSGEAKRQADRAMPASSDPARQASARDATRFLDGRGDNPFGGLTQDELNAVVFNESGAYTMKERRAAFTALKQYLPSAATGASGGTSTSTDAEANSSTGTAATGGSYNTQSAYKSRLIRQLTAAQATTALLSAMSTFNTRASGFGISNYLGGGFSI